MDVLCSAVHLVRLAHASRYFARARSCFLGSKRFTCSGERSPVCPGDSRLSSRLRACRLPAPGPVSRDPRDCLRRPRGCPSKTREIGIAFRSKDALTRAKSALRVPLRVPAPRIAPWFPTVFTIEAAPISSPTRSQAHLRLLRNETGNAWSFSKCFGTLRLVFKFVNNELWISGGLLRGPLTVSWIHRTEYLMEFNLVPLERVERRILRHPRVKGHARP